MLTSFGHSAWSCHYATRNGTAAAAPSPPGKPAAHVKCSISSSQTWGIQQNPSAGFKTSIYHQHPYLQDDQLLSMKHSQKLDEVGNLLRAAGREDSGMGLRLVNAIQRLEIDHHFQEEIEALLQRHYYSSGKNRPISLHDASLYFRLLRQEGHCVAPDIFNDFMNENGRFNLKTEVSDIKALMGLYEAAQLSVEGEEILDAAADSTSQLLNAWTRYLDDLDARIVKHTLTHPYRKSLARLKPITNSTSTVFQGINEAGKIRLQELSDVENYMAKGIHRQGLLQISKWWEDLGLGSELKRARDQPKKWYAWSIGCLSDLSLSDERLELTKTISFIYLIDDIFDLYGEPHHLTLFTQAVERWDLDAIDQLPDYMKKCFRALYDMTKEAGLKIQKKHGFNPTGFLRKTWADLCCAFLTESRWFGSGFYKPKADEYLENAKVSSGLHVVAVHLFFLLGFGTGSTARKSPITLDDASGIISSVATILRLWDDLGSSKDEGQSGHDGSFVDYYVNDHKGVAVEFARDKVSNMISEEWKRLNKECLRLDRSSSSFQKATLNLARMVPLMYSYSDKQLLPDLQDYVELVL